MKTKSQFPRLVPMLLGILCGGLAALNAPAATFTDDNWISMGGIPGANGEVYAAVTDADGNLYIGGAFTVVGDVAANRVAKWDGTNWTSLGTGMNDPVYALAVSGGDLYAGGVFVNAGGVPARYVAKWNGTNWSGLNSQMDYAVSALAVYNGELYAGGYFENAGGHPASYIARWNGDTWNAVGAGTDGFVGVLAVAGGNLYAGGEFTSAGGSPAKYLAKWNGSSWSQVGSGLDDLPVGYGFVAALAASGGDLYVGGAFATTGGNPATNIAKWNGSDWSAVGNGTGFHDELDENPGVLALAVSGSQVVAGGRFTSVDGVSANGVARWDGSSWSALGSGFGWGFYRNIYAVAMAGTNVFVAGDFTTADGIAARYIARWNESGWSAPGFTPKLGEFRPAGFRRLGSDLYALGAITTATGISKEQ
ncbi:MAG: hypothetical protein KIS67_05070 [Verrucomicrobiae bacterium]|nr:hypothetical protein [Verrucomicrobiae bacterium]